MKKKLTTLLTLALLGISSAWADGTPITITWLNSEGMASTPSKAGTASTSGILTVSDLAVSSDINSTLVRRSFDATAHYYADFMPKTLVGANKTYSKDDYITFAVTVKEGYTFTPTSVSAYAKGRGTGNNAAKIFSEVQTSNGSGGINNSSNDNPSSISLSTFSSTSYAAGETLYFYIHIGTNSWQDQEKGESKGVILRDVVLTGTYASAAAPTITTNKESASLTAIESGVAVNNVISVSGANLTKSGTLALSFSPSVTGLSVSPTNISIDEDGAISATNITVSYSSTSNVKAGSTTLTLSDGTTSKEIAINYYARVEDWTLQSISKSTTWTFDDSNITSGTKSGGATTSTVYANIEEMTFGNDFDATALEMAGNYPYYSPAYIAQAKTMKFNTTVPGIVKVTWQAPSADTKYISINGGDNGSTGSSVITTEVAVAAGDVTIAGYTTSDHSAESLLNISKVQFVQTFGIAYATGLEHGSITGPATSAAGETVTVTATPDGGYELDELTIYKASDDSDVTASCSVSNNTFVMPAYAVKVSATFSAFPIVTMPTETRTGYISSLASSTISGTGYTMNGQKAYSVSNGGSFTITIPAITTVSKIKVIGTSADNSNASTVTITGANSEHASATLNLRKAASVSEFEFVPTTQTTTYTISSATKGSYLQIAIYGTEAPTQTITTNKGGWTSYTPVKNATLSEGATAYIVTDVNSTTVTATKVTTMKAGEGYFIKGETGSYTATFTDASADVTDGNLVKGCLVATTIDGSTPNTNSKFILGTNTANDEAGLFSVDSEITIPAGKAYLDAETTVAARSLSLDFEEGGTTGISSIHNAQCIMNNEVFDLQGRKVAQPKKGLYIMNGRKFVIK